MATEAEARTAVMATKVFIVSVVVGVIVVGFLLVGENCFKHKSCRCWKKQEVEMDGTKEDVSEVKEEGDIYTPGEAARRSVREVPVTSHRQ
jgi:DNA polymerase III delta prime subunit